MKTSNHTKQPAASTGIRMDYHKQSNIYCIEFCCCCRFLFFFIPVCIYNLISVSTRRREMPSTTAMAFYALCKTHSHRICSQFCLIANFQHQHQQHRFLLFCRQFFRSFVPIHSHFFFVSGRLPVPFNSNQSKWKTDVLVLNSMIENRS